MEHVKNAAKHAIHNPLHDLRGAHVGNHVMKELNRHKHNALKGAHRRGITHELTVKAKTAIKKLKLSPLQCTIVFA